VNVFSIVTRRLKTTAIDIGVGASKFLEVQRIFCPNFPKFVQDVIVQFLPTVVWCDLPKMVFTCFSVDVGHHFYPDFQRFCLDI